MENGKRVMEKTNEMELKTNSVQNTVERMNVRNLVERIFTRTIGVKMCLSRVSQR